MLWLLSAVGQTEPGCERTGHWGLLTRGARAEDNAVLGRVCRTGSGRREINIRDKHLCVQRIAAWWRGSGEEAVSGLLDKTHGESQPGFS